MHALHAPGREQPPGQLVDRPVPGDVGDAVALVTHAGEAAVELEDGARRARIDGFRVTVISWPMPGGTASPPCG